ncbi:MAG: hypothetical protein IJN28_05355 [Selenomonadales bacterium]|nr:hypothetical protein [Selenomonadales bacterium]
MDNIDPILKRRYYALLITIMNENFSIDQAMAWMHAKDTARPKKKKTTAD